MKTILDLCAGTGAWSEPYRIKGYNVIRITLPDYDVTKVNISDREVVFLSQNPSVSDVVVKLVRIHGILAAPPCTQFSLANTRQTYALRPNFAEGLVPVRACEDIIRAAMCKGYTKFWALENPFGHLRKFLGHPRYTFEAWWFDPEAMWSKKTDLWGYFNNPVRTVEERPARHTNQQRDQYRHTDGWYKPQCPPEYAHLGLDRAGIRAITPKGFAQAFYRANK
ncbi:methyltransferase [Mycobacterium phage Nilo]|uniref:Methyltransferase n=1 Tax=Mycobacterium phage Nilo TaxID=2108129 RepID=A0A2P1JQW7_9CAUD|nr:methyltransferase [Mycobacterium phage Nilo]